MEEIKNVLIENEELVEPAMEAVIENTVSESASGTNFKAIGLGIVVGIASTYIIPKAIKYIKDERQKNSLRKERAERLESATDAIEDLLNEDDKNFENINK